MSIEKASIKDCMDYMLELLLVIDKTCKELGIEYWIDGGTLLGAVRHEGYIPWDDDIDVCLMADDYKKLTQRLSELSEHHEYYICLNDHRPKMNWGDNFGDVRILKDGVVPIKIDLIPFKSIPNDKNLIQRDISLVNIAKYFRDGVFKDFNDVVEDHKVYLPKSKSEFLAKKIEFFEFYVGEYLYSNSTINKDFLYTYVCNDTNVKRKREYYRHENLFPLKTIKFEGHHFSAPNDEDGYLRILYGNNYIVPPPEDQRIPYAYNNYFSKIPKSLVKSRIDLHFEREFKLGVARSSKSYFMRLMRKFFTFCDLSYKAILKGDVSFVFIYLKFSLRHFIN